MDVDFNTNVHVRHHKLRTLFIENPGARRILDVIADIIGEYRAAQEFGGKFETRGMAVLGPSGAGKTQSVIQALLQLGLAETIIGDSHRPYIMVELSANASLRGLCADVLREYGWTANQRDTAQTIWNNVSNYIRDLKTYVIILDEIQHVRTAGPKDRAALRDFLKSLVQPRGTVVIPILVGMSSFHEVLISDDQLRRRYKRVHMQPLDPAIDLKRAIKTLARYVSAAEMTMEKSVESREFAARLIHTSGYAFGELCVYCRAGIKMAMFENSQSVGIEHFAAAYWHNTDCFPAVNPFIAVDFRNIQISEPPIDT
ncbi:MAG: TniB family NTP-binding protein [Litoreibacter sp.]